MIVLKILIWIFLAILGIILLFLIIPAGAEVSYINKKMTYKIMYGFINLYDSDGHGIAVKFINKSNRKNKKKKTDDIQKNQEDTDSFSMPKPDEVYDNNETVETDDDIIEYAELEKTEAENEFIEELKKSEDNKNKKSEKEKSDGKIEEFLDKLDEYESKIDKALDIVRAADRPLLHLFKGFRFSRIYIDFMIADEDAYKCALNYGRISGAVYNMLGWLGTVCTTEFETVDIFPDFKQKDSRWDISAKLRFRFITPIVAGVHFLITYMFRFFIPQKMQERKLKKSRKSKK